MEVIVVVLIAAYAGTITGFGVYLNAERKRTDARERQLLNRIQAPEMAAAASVVEQTEDFDKAYVSVFDDDEFQAEVDRLERGT